MVARVLVGCSGQLLVLLSVCQGVLDGCQAVAMWLLGCLDLFIACKKKKTPFYARLFIGGCQGVARVF